MDRAGFSDLSAVDKTQADGPFTLAIGAGANWLQVTISVSAQPTAGTLTLTGEAHTGIGFAPVVDSAGSPIVVDMTAINTVKTFLISGYLFNTLKFAPTGFDAAKTYTVYVKQGRAA